MSTVEPKVERILLASDDSEVTLQGDIESQPLPKQTPSFPEGGLAGWIGGVQVFFNFSAGLLVGRLFDRGYFYHMMVAAVIISGLSLFMLSLCQQNQFYQASGESTQYYLSIVSHYFNKRRPMAMGIVAAGSALGATVHPIILNKVIHSLGFANGVRVSAGFNLVCLIIGVLCMRTRLPPSTTGKNIPLWEFLHDPPYVAMLIGALFVFCGLFFPVFFIQVNAIQHGVDTNFAFYSIPILNGASIVGRMLPGFFAPKYGVWNLSTFFTFFSGVVILTMLAVKDVAGTAIFAVFVGIFTGGAIGVFAPMLSSLAKDVNEVGVRIGVVCGACGILGLFASPIAGALLTSNFLWVRPILFAGITFSGGSFFYLVARHMVAKRKGSQWI
ncbi:major facilitator superfamily domain-containing protein [Mycena floridula]|nr:major facilitator superfamily domain-containing protein [Mycena floridula]